ncbi:DUF3592 domain-containing protein [Streptomyces sp. NPDC028635]|uniref:DUF3592 domain-containing protein n=1 Tax=Streptomyces sp. NPDC028635 TaxID=3154800 RepID=UPI0033E26C32
MEVLFSVVPLLMIAGAVHGAVRVVGRARRISRTWSDGLTAEARCLRTYTTTGGGGDSAVHTHLHHVYEFVSRDGRAVRFEERGGPGTTLVGDIVTVRYPADRPEGATALPPAPGRLAVEAGCLLSVLGVVVVVCVIFMIVAHAMFSMAGDALP